MRWPWRRRESDRADQALAQSREQLEQAQRQRDEVRRLAERLRDLREANHFAESIRRALGEGR